MICLFYNMRNNKFYFKLNVTKINDTSELSLFIIFGLFGIKYYMDNMKQMEIGDVFTIIFFF